VGAAIAASAFAPGWTHPAKEAADGAFRSFGYQPPGWYTALAPGTRAGDPEVLAQTAAAAGFTRVRVRTVSVPTGLATPAERAVAMSLDGVTGGGPLVVSMVMLTAS